MNAMIRRGAGAEMSWRARTYLSIAATRHLVLGWAAIALHDEFQSRAFEVITGGIPIWGWGIVFLLGGVHLMYAAVRASETHARWSLAMSAVVTSVWAAGMLAAWLGPAEVSPLGGILFATLTLKDLTVVRDPMRSPFEPIVKEYAGQSGGR